MLYLSIILFIVGLVFLVTGYRGNKRNLLLIAAILLFLSGLSLYGPAGDFIQGFLDGISGA